MNSGGGSRIARKRSISRKQVLQAADSAAIGDVATLRCGVTVWEAWVWVGDDFSERLSRVLSTGIAITQWQASGCTSLVELVAETHRRA